MDKGRIMIRVSRYVALVGSVHCNYAWVKHIQCQPTRCFRLSPQRKAFLFSFEVNGGSLWPPMASWQITWRRQSR